jgi:hypothetical protein
MFSYHSNINALSDLNVKILTGVSGPVAATVAPIALHGFVFKHTNHPVAAKIGFEALAAVVAGGATSALTYVILRQYTPEYKVAFAKNITHKVKEDKFYTRMIFCASDELALVSGLFFGPHNPLEAGLQHIYMLQHRLNIAMSLVTQAFHETKDTKSLALFHNDCMNTIKEIIDLKRELENITCADTQNPSDGQVSNNNDINLLRVIGLKNDSSRPKRTWLTRK